jgi:outer membrane protein assembly factor BamC
MDSLYSTGELDRFRTRLERTPNGTEIFISHRGMEEVYSSSRKDQTTWQPRASDPELEAEFLRRLMVKLGVSQEQSKVIAAAGPAPQTTKVANVGGQPVVQINDNFERAWRRVGLALDRTGFTVEDRDRAAGTYFVRYVPPNPNKSEPSMFSKLFSSSKTEAPLKFRILVKGQGETSTVSVLNEAGAADSTANAQRIVQVIADDLK